jgi:hypothetical protein
MTNNDIIRMCTQESRDYFTKGLTEDQVEVLFNYADSLIVKLEDGIQGQLNFVYLLDQKKKELLQG